MKERQSTFLPNITAFPVAFLSGISNVAKSLDIFAMETFLVVKNEQCGRGTGSCNVPSCYDKLKRRIHLFRIFVIFCILLKKKKNQSASINARRIRIPPFSLYTSKSRRIRNLDDFHEKVDILCVELSRKIFNSIGKHGS